jgi:peptide/nickel transport system permease protein
MSAYILRRVLVALPVLLGITIIGFVALAMAPGDPLLSRIDPSQIAQFQLNPELMEQRREELGLNDPIHVRYLAWLGGVVQGDLGYSLLSRRLVVDDLASRIPPTLALMGATIIIALVVGIPLGILSAVRQYSKLDYVLTSGTMLFLSTPNFVLGLAAIYVFGVWLDILPTSGIQTLGEPFTIPDFASHLILPALVLGLSNAAEIMRHTRASLLEEMGREYLTTARSKGLGGRRVMWRHAFRNSLLPIVTVVGLLLPQMMAGAVITEQIFAWPGMGQLAVGAAQERDSAVMMGVILVIGIGVLLSTIVVDILYVRVDPRIRLGGS